MSEASEDRALGIVIGKLEAIDDRLTHQDESRAILHKRLDDLVLRTTHLESDVSSITTKVQGMEKVTVEMTTLRTKAEGAGTVGRWLLRVGIGIVGFVGWVFGLYTWLTGRPPP